MRIEIFKEEDRMIAAAILVKNGYRVNQGKCRKAPNSKAYVYFLEVEKVSEEVKPDES